MPANHQLDYQGLKISVHTEPSPDPVLWTHQKPTLVITFRNSQESITEWAEDSSVRVSIEVDDDQIWSEIVSFGPLGHGESTTVRIETVPLSFEGHAVVSIATGRIENLKSEDTPADLEPGHSDYSSSPCYTFSVWDESHYDATVRTPKKLQIGTIITSVALMIFAAVQVWIAL